jgi:hypothetical protein
VFSPSIKSIQAEVLASAMWDNVCEWPIKHGAELVEEFGGCLHTDIKHVFEEMVYFLAFGTDYVFWRDLMDKPQIRDAVRGPFTASLREFAEEHHCRPVPSGKWLHDNSLIWVRSATTDEGRPLLNLERKFGLYALALERRHDRCSGERAAHILAALCGMTMQIFFIEFAALEFTAQFVGTHNSLKRYEIKP